jgi:hypothetical protein
MSDSGSPVGINDIAVSHPPKDFEDDFAESLQYERDRKGLELRGIKQDLEERKSYAGGIFDLVRGWVIAIFFLILLQGFGTAIGFFRLDASVMLAAIGGTTLNVLGLFYVVANHPKR